MKIIEAIKKKTIIIIDEIYLVEQWKEYLLNNTNLNPDKLLCLTGKMKKEDKLKLEKIEEMDIVIATKGTLVNRPGLIDIINDNFGLNINDEVHVSSATVFTEVISSLKMQWTLGLTASPNRDDGLIFLVINNCGHILYTGTIYDSAKLGSSIIPDLKPIFLMKKNPYMIKEGETYHKIAETIFKDNSVINYICKNIKKHYLLNDNQLCITQKVEESKELKNKLIKDFGIKENEICVLLGETELEERLDLIEEIKKGNIKIVISSLIFDKGKDMPCNRYVNRIYYL